MRFRKLRIAWSVVWGIACVLLIVLWVRSYTGGDVVCFGGVRLAKAQRLWISTRGRIESITTFVTWVTDDEGRWFWTTPLQLDLFQPETPKYSFAGIYWYTDPIPAILISDWLVLFVLGVGAAAAWIRWRFSLRTLLVATTLVAVVLGIIIYVIR